MHSLSTSSRQLGRSCLKMPLLGCQTCWLAFWATVRTSNHVRVELVLFQHGQQLAAPLLVPTLMPGTLLISSSPAAALSCSSSGDFSTAFGLYASLMIIAVLLFVCTLRGGSLPKRHCLCLTQCISCSALTSLQRLETKLMMPWMTILRSCVTSWVSQQILNTIRINTRTIKPLIQSPARNFSAFCSTYTTPSRLVHPTLCCRCVCCWLAVAATGISSGHPLLWRCRLLSSKAGPGGTWQR